VQLQEARMPTPAFDWSGKPTGKPKVPSARPSALAGEREPAKIRRLQDDVPRMDFASEAREPREPLRKIKVLSWTAHEFIHIGFLESDDHERAFVHGLGSQKDEDLMPRQGDVKDGLGRMNMQEEREKRERRGKSDQGREREGEIACAMLQQEKAESQEKQRLQVAQAETGSASGDARVGRTREGRELTEARKRDEEKQCERNEEQAARKREDETGEMLVIKSDSDNHAGKPHAQNSGAQIGQKLSDRLNAKTENGGKTCVCAEGPSWKGVQRAGGVFWGMDNLHGPTHSDHMEEKMRCAVEMER
jgi:hypothetical protein